MLIFTNSSSEYNLPLSSRLAEWSELGAGEEEWSIQKSIFSLNPSCSALMDVYV